MFRTIATIFKILIYGFAILLGVTFAVSNRGKIELTFGPVPYSLTLPLFLFAILVFTLGIFIGWSVAGFKTGRYKRLHKQSVRRTSALENEIGTLRTQKLVNPAAATLLAQK